MSAGSFRWRDAQARIYTEIDLGSLNSDAVAIVRKLVSALTDEQRRKIVFYGKPKY